MVEKFAPPAIGNRNIGQGNRRAALHLTHSHAMSAANIPMDIHRSCNIALRIPQCNSAGKRPQDVFKAGQPADTRLVFNHTLFFQVLQQKLDILI